MNKNKQKMKTKKKTAWAIGISVMGMWDKKPVRIEYSSFNETCSRQRFWWDKTGCFTVDKLGLVVKKGITTFASESKKDVELFILGVKAMSRRVNFLAWTSIDENLVKELKELNGEI
jgi:hypothetical protein